MYLTRRENGFRFQRRIPKNLEPLLGKSPIRIHLGNLPARDASRIARLLASNSDLLFQKITLEGCRTLTDIPDDPNDPNDPDYNKRMDALVSELERLAIEDMKTTKHLLDVLGEDDQPQKLRPAEQLERSAFELSQARHEREKKAFHSESKTTSERLIQEAAAVKSELEHISKQVTGMRDDITAVRESVDQSLEGGAARPLTTDALEDWHHNIRLKEGINAKKTTTDYNRIKDFIAFAGDQPVNKYKYDQFQKYAFMLAAVPSNYNKKPHLRDMSLEAVSDYNQNLPDNERLDALSVTTIETNYLSPLRVFFKDMGNQYEFTSPVVDNKFRLPTFTKGTVDRKPFTVDELNKWFAVSAIAKQPDMKWMPLLGAFTGARVGELVTLQRKDIYKVESGGWVIDLTTHIIDADGVAKVRKVKNTSSRRVIALPEFIVKTGFFDYVKGIPKDSNLFPGCFYHGKTRVKDPAGAASKRLNKQLKNAGIHSNIETTFHSTRHTAKDMMRVAKIDERTHDKQTGHSNKTVSRNYGAKKLLNEEIEVLRALPIPEGLDLSPYLSGK